MSDDPADPDPQLEEFRQELIAAVASDYTATDLLAKSVFILGKHLGAKIGGLKFRRGTRFKFRV